MDEPLAGAVSGAGNRHGRGFHGSISGGLLEGTAPRQLPAWHLVGGVDPLDEGELTGSEPEDEYPVLLADWIQTDGLKCLKIKLRGNDAGWDFARVVKIGQIALEHGVDWLTTDFNCTVTEPAYVNAILDRLCVEHPHLRHVACGAAVSLRAGA